MFFDLLGIEDVIIPIEYCFICFLQFSEEFFFYFIQHIEADKYIFVVFKLICIKLFDNIAIKHSFISNA